MKNLCTALAEAFAEFEGASKSKPNPAFRSKYADLSAVIDAVKPALVKHGLFYSQITHEHPGGVTVETVVSHTSGEQMSFGRLFVPAGKQDAHGYGSALTYARRYSLMTAFGIPAEDDDGNAAAKSAPRADPVPGDRISGDQLATLMTYSQAGLIDAGRFCRFFQIDALNELPASRFEEARAMAEAKAKKLETAK